MFSLFTLAALSIIAFSPGKCNPLIRLCVFCGTRKRRKRSVFTCSGRVFMIFCNQPGHQNGKGDHMAFLKEHQLNIMLFMSGVCCILTVLTAVPKSLSSRRRSILAMMTLSAMLLPREIFVRYESAEHDALPAIVFGFCNDRCQRRMVCYAFTLREYGHHSAQETCCYSSRRPLPLL